MHRGNRTPKGPRRAGLPAAAGLLLAFAAAAPAGPMDDPMGYFNVYSLGRIGSGSAGFQGEIFGVAGAGGDVHLAAGALHGLNSTTGWALHAAGDVTLSGTVLNGIDVGGNVQLGAAGVAGTVSAGGSVTATGPGAIGGDVLAGGSVSLAPGVTVDGQTVSGAAWSSITDHVALTDFFVDKSQQIASMDDTGGWTEQDGEVRFVGSAGVNVLTVDAATLKLASTFTIIAPEGTVVYINVPDEDIQLDWTAWRYEGGLDAADVLLNLSGATSLELSSTNAVNILAPLADATLQDGLLAGSIVVGNLDGSGQINPGSFEHLGGPVPEPATLMLLAALALPLLARRTRRQGARQVAKT